MEQKMKNCVIKQDYTIKKSLKQVDAFQKKTQIMASKTL